MERRWIIGLVATIGMALLGLVGIQVHWIRSTVSARESQLVQGIDNALFVVSDKLEQLERIHTLRNEPAGRQLLLRLDTLRT